MSDTTTDGPIMGWSGVMTVLGRWAGNLDRRLIREADWLTLPRTFALNHDSDVAVGSVDHMEIRDDGETRYVWGRGRFSNTAEGIQAATQLEEQVLRTVSIEIRDGDAVQTPVLNDEGMEVGLATDWQWVTLGSLAFERQPAHGGAVIMPDAEAASFVPDSPDPASTAAEGTLAEEDIILAEPEMLTATLSGMRASSDDFRQAGAGPHVFPAAHFSRIDYGGPTRLTISPDDGEVTGYPVLWGKTHRADRSWTAAKNPADDLSEWLVGSTSLDDGRTIRTGVIVSDGLHAPAHQSGAHADTVRQLIESTASQVAVVNAWADEHGIAVHGSTLPGVTVEQATRAMAGCPSVDQRNLGDGRGFVTMGVLMVNTCGFTPGDAVVSVEDGEPVRRLVASAAPESCGCPEPEPPKVVDVAALAKADAEYAKARLKAAVAPRPK